ncbi:hypothetical protein MP228_012784 [Amoeboaphelidium protococcarum]|nr:hypothetical protein MP228_012784 [Amoeboaphelidium protococcarum]
MWLLLIKCIVLLLPIVKGSQTYLQLLDDAQGRDILQRVIPRRPTLLATEDPLHYFYRVKQHCGHLRRLFSVDQNTLRLSFQLEPDWQVWCLSMEYRTIVYMLLFKIRWPQDDSPIQSITRYGQDLILFNSLTILANNDGSYYSYLTKLQIQIIKLLSESTKKFPAEAYQDFSISFESKGYVLSRQDKSYLRVLDQLQFKQKRIFRTDLVGNTYIVQQKSGVTYLGVNVDEQYPSSWGSIIRGNLHAFWLKQQSLSLISHKFQTIEAPKVLELEVSSYMLESLAQDSNYGDIRFQQGTQLSHTRLVRFKFRWMFLNAYSQNAASYALIIKKLVAELRSLSLEKGLMFRFDFIFRFNDHHLRDKQCVDHARSVYEDFWHNIIPRDGFMELHGFDSITIQKLDQNGFLQLVNNDIVINHYLTQILKNGLAPLNFNFRSMDIQYAEQYRYEINDIIKSLPQGIQALPFEDMSLECKQISNWYLWFQKWNFVTDLPIKRYNIIVWTLDLFIEIIKKWDWVIREQSVFSEHFQYITVSYYDKAQNRLLRVVLEGDVELGKTFGATTRGELMRGTDGVMVRFDRWLRRISIPFA